jgi:hypothetical protein
MQLTQPHVPLPSGLAVDVAMNGLACQANALAEL